MNPILVHTSFSKESRDLLNNYTTSIAVYDVEEKKLVLLFYSKSFGGKYLYGRGRRGADCIHNIFKRKDLKSRKCNKNIFNKTLAFRACNEEQRLLLGENYVVVLDERYRRSEKEIEDLFSKMS